MIGTVKEVINWLLSQNQEKLYEVEEHHEKRSLTANAYAWCLIGKIADVARSSKEEIYLEMLKSYGQSTIISVLSHINISSYFKYYEPIATVTLQGKEFTHYKIYKGSSEYDSREMAILIDGIISEAETLGISTLPPHEIARLKELWSRKE